MFKFDLGQTVWFIASNTVYCTPITSRTLVENLRDENGYRQRNSFGDDCINYATKFGTHREKSLYASKEELFKHLTDTIVAE